MPTGIPSIKINHKRGNAGHLFRSGFPENCKNGEIKNKLGEVFVPQEGEYIVKAFDYEKCTFDAQYSVTNLGNVFSHKRGMDKDTGKPTTKWLISSFDGRYYKVNGWNKSRLVFFSIIADALVKGTFDAIDPDRYYDLGREDFVTDDYEAGKVAVRYEAVKRLAKLKKIIKAKIISEIDKKPRSKYEVNHMNGVEDNRFDSLQLLLFQNNDALGDGFDLTKKRSRQKLLKVIGEKPAIVCKNQVKQIKEKLFITFKDVKTRWCTTEELQALIEEQEKEEKQYIKEYKEKRRKDA